MDLKSGCIFWPAVDGPPPAVPALDRDPSCDVAVIGAGITGALVADRLAREGRSVVVLDRRPVCSGSTPASTGLLQYEIDTPLHELVELVGEDNARRAYRASVRSLDDLRDLVGTLDDDCGLVARPSLYLASEPSDVDGLRKEQAARRAIDVHVDLLGEADLRRDFGFRRAGALRSTRAMEVDPYRLALALLRRATTAGARLFANTPVVSYEPDDGGVTLVTGNGDRDGGARSGGNTTRPGPRVRATHVVFATGYETPEFLDRSICTLKSTYALASQPLASFGGWRDRCLIWECGRPYFYARTTPDGRAMVGGEDDDFADPAARDASIGRKSLALVEKFHELFPGMPIEPQCAWAGTFAETKDGLPYIGTVPEFPRGYFALGYGGNGITFSVIAAGLISDLIAGRGNDDAEVFRFGR